MVGLMRVFIIENGLNNEIFLPYDNSTEKKITTFKYTLVARLMCKYHKYNYKQVLNHIWRGEKNYYKYEKILSNDDYEKEDKPQISINNYNNYTRNKGEKIDKYLERMFK